MIPEVPQPHQYYSYVMFFAYSAFILYAMSLCLYGLIGFFKKELGSGTLKPLLYKLASVLIGFGIVASLVSFSIRWVAGDRLPLNNIFETLSYFAMTVALIYLILDRFYKVAEAGLYILVFVVVSLGMVAFSGWFEFERTMISASRPALNSYWLPIHVIVTISAYAGFAIAAACSFKLLLADLLASDASREGLKPFLTSLDGAAYKVIGISYIMLSAGIITGSVWANEAWGQYWMWDPKEVWSLITWFYFTIYLHVRMRKDLGVRVWSLMALFGMAFVIFTYIGVSYLKVFSGEHSF